MSGKGPITARYLLAKRNFLIFQKEIRRLLTREKKQLTVADDSNQINGKSLTAIMQPARDLLAAHIADLNNPHEETITSVGSYPSQVVTDEVRRKIPKGILPVSTYGVSDALTDAQVNAAWTYSGWVLNCIREMNVIISGTPYRLGTFSIDLTAISQSPANSTFHVYLYLKYGVVSYKVMAESPPEGVAVMYIGTVTTGTTGIIAKDFRSVIRIDTFRISSIPRGSVIPVSGGTYTQIVPFGDPWKPV